LEKPCVVKRLLPESAHDAERVARFRREAEIARRLSHGAIAQTLAVDEVAGEPFIIQEFLEGRTVTQVVSAAQGAGEHMPVHLAIHIVREVARALAYAHRAEGGGVIHRDVSPHNIMLTFSGEVRLIDFGIARAPTDPSLTQDGLVIGKESYTAPELPRGGVADRRADTYSLGVVLWELLAGQPFGLTAAAGAPAPSLVAESQDIPPELDAVALKALAERPEDRFQTGEEFQRALGPFLPTAFVGETAVSEFIGRCYDVATERHHLAEALEEGKALLDSSSDEILSTPLALPSNSKERSQAPMVIGVAILLALATGVASWARHRPRSTPGTANVAQVLPAVSPSERSVAVPQVRPSVPVALPEPNRIPTPLPVTAISKPAPSARPRSIASAADVLLGRARDSLQIGELAIAEREARQAIKEGSPAQKARGHAIVGQVFVLSGRSNEAESEFEQAIHLDPSNETASAALTGLRRARASRREVGR
jgi:serine/threonine protein kinase